MNNKISVEQRVGNVSDDGKVVGVEININYPEGEVSEERELTDAEIEHGLSRLQSLIPERAPAMTDFFLKQAGILGKYLGVDKSSVSESALPRCRFQ